MYTRKQRHFNFRHVYVRCTSTFFKSEELLVCVIFSKMNNSVSKDNFSGQKRDLNFCYKNSRVL